MRRSPKSHSVGHFGPQIFRKAVNRRQLLPVLLLDSWANWSFHLKFRNRVPPILIHEHLHRRQRVVAPTLGALDPDLRWACPFAPFGAVSLVQLIDLIIVSQSVIPSPVRRVPWFLINLDINDLRVQRLLLVLPFFDQKRGVARLLNLRVSNRPICMTNHFRWVHQLRFAPIRCQLLNRALSLSLYGLTLAISTWVWHIITPVFEHRLWPIHHDLRDPHRPIVFGDELRSFRIVLINPVRKLQSWSWFYFELIVLLRENYFDFIIIIIVFIKNGRVPLRFQKFQRADPLHLLLRQFHFVLINSSVIAIGRLIVRMLLNLCPLCHFWRQLRSPWNFRQKWLRRLQGVAITRVVKPLRQTVMVLTKLRERILLLLRRDLILPGAVTIRHLLQKLTILLHLLRNLDVRIPV